MNYKKLTTGILAFAVAVTASLPFATSATAQLTGAELKGLRDALINNGAMTESYDVNGDKVIDVFDLCAMRKALNAPGEVAEYNIPATEDYVKIMGRTCRIDDVTWLVQSGAAAEFNVTGTSATVTIAGDDNINSDENYRPRYAVFVDDELVTDALMSTETLDVTLFEGTETRTAKVKVIHLSEANNGAIGVKNIAVTSDRAVPVTPLPENDLCIEFIGDSITCAYGVEGASAYEAFKTSTENFMKSYAYLTAEKLGADYSAVSYSGFGVVSGYTSSGDINTDSLVPDCYGNVGKYGNYAVEWDFSKRKNDVVVVNLGTNDSGYVSKDPENRSGEFIDAYVTFLKTIREKNPDAYIICTLGTMGCADVYEFVADAVEQYSSETGDERIMSYLSTTQNQADGIGSDWHPSAVTQQKSAYVLADKICNALGMESDQIGLDVASEAEYILDFNSADGANVSHYVDLQYAMSFWVNAVTSGDSIDDVEAILSGIGLKEGGGYIFEFEYTSSNSFDMPVIIRSNSDESVEYFRTEVSTSSEKQHYSIEFTAPATDADTSIVFQMGGYDSTNTTLSNIKLTKVS